MGPPRSGARGTNQPALAAELDRREAEANAVRDAGELWSDALTHARPEPPPAPVKTSALDFLVPIPMSRKRRKRRSKSTFSCGHPRTPENTRVARGRGYTWGKCRLCDNRYMRAYMRRRERERLLRLAAAGSQAAAKPPQAGADQTEA